MNCKLNLCYAITNIAMLLNSCCCTCVPMRCLPRDSLVPRTSDLSSVCTRGETAVVFGGFRTDFGPFVSETWLLLCQRFAKLLRSLFFLSFLRLDKLLSSRTVKGQALSPGFVPALFSLRQLRTKCFTRTKCGVGG